MPACGTMRAVGLQVKVVGTPAPPVYSGDSEPHQTVAARVDGGARPPSTTEPHGTGAQIHEAGMLPVLYHVLMRHSHVAWERFTARI